ncbi:hypothetical protein [Pseudomonas sp. ML2-2023-6]|uniref:hypothetical protein n=1 Tax=Pseudomonas sp. ML2-2023-6 TaxID=3122376 RepID=UPI0030D340C4
MLKLGALAHADIDLSVIFIGHNNRLEALCRDTLAEPLDRSVQQNFFDTPLPSEAQSTISD